MRDKILKILLVHPPGNRVIRADGERGLKAAVIPLGIAYLAAVLRQSGYEVGVVDAAVEGYDNPEIELEQDIFRYGLTDDQIFSRIESFAPDLVAVSCPQTARQPEANAVAALAKRYRSNLPVVMGGASPSALKSELLRNCADVDYILAGESEESLLFLVSALNGGNGLDRVPGLVWRDGPGLRENLFTGGIRDLDLIPFPAYDLLPMEVYFEKNRTPSVVSKARRVGIMVTSRGCPHVCYYCPVHNVFGAAAKPRFRYRSPANVCDEIELLVKRYGVEEIQFEDSSYNCLPKHAIGVADEIGRRFPGLQWCTPHGNQVSTLSAEVLNSMWQGGCYSLHLAIESGNQKFLDRRKKTVRLTDTDRIMAGARDLGFDLNVFMMIGYPEETLDDIRATVEYSRLLDVDDVHFFIATPFPGTEMYSMCVQQGLVRSDESLRHFRYSWGVITTSHFNPGVVRHIRREAWLELRRKAASQKNNQALLDEKRIYG